LLASGGAVRVDSSLTLKAIAYRADGTWADSLVATAAYAIK
jgi:hypothetical protein